MIAWTSLSLCMPPSKMWYCAPHTRQNISDRRCVYLRSYTLMAISQVDSCETKMKGIGCILYQPCHIKIWPHSWPWPRISQGFRVTFFMTICQELLSDWCENERNPIDWVLGKIYDLSVWPHQWPWFCKGQSLQKSYHINRRAYWHGTKDTWVDYS